MWRSGNLKGATVLLDLLPKTLGPDITPDTGVAVHCHVAVLPMAEADLRHALQAVTLVRDSHALPLGPLLAHADLAAALRVAPDRDCVADLVSGRVPAALAKVLMRLASAETAAPDCLYALALCLAGLNRNGEALTAIMLPDGASAAHPAVLSLYGYLALLAGQSDLGRRLLARGALVARNQPTWRPILHFAQHVLLVHQFGG